MTDSFYENLKGFTQFAELSKPGHYQPAPGDWFVVVTDIENSTSAIDSGKYKEINLSGAAAIMSVLNITGKMAIPYTFGGDGATMLIPAGHVEKTLEALAAVQSKVHSAFDLTLRAGVIGVQALYDEGASLQVGKFFLGVGVSQAMFQGNALSLAERWLKKGHANVQLAGKHQGEPDLQGLECRWEPIQNRNGKIVSLLVKVTPAYEEHAWETYAECLKAIEAIYPEHAKSCPSNALTLRLSFSPKMLYREVCLRAGHAWYSKLTYLLEIMTQNLIGAISFATGRKLLGFDGKQYKQELISNSDSRKFDETLRMVLDSTQEQHDTLRVILQKRHEAGQIVYGMHESPQALMTCLVFSAAGNHVHLVDGADGGYALAAKQMKQQSAGS